MTILYADGWSNREMYQQNDKIHKTVRKKVEKIALLQIRTNMITERIHTVTFKKRIKSASIMYKSIRF
jgi:hypothetical protein